MAKRWKGALHDLAASRTAATAIEYAIIAALIATVIVGALPAIGSGLSNVLRTVGAALGA